MTNTDIAELVPGLAALRGREIGVSPWTLVDQEAIDQFSALTRGRFVLRDLVARGESAAVMTMAAVVEVEGSETPAIVADWLGYLQLGAGGHTS